MAPCLNSALQYNFQSVVSTAILDTEKPSNIIYNKSAKSANSQQDNQRPLFFQVFFLFFAIFLFFHPFENPAKNVVFLTQCCKKSTHQAIKPNSNSSSATQFEFSAPGVNPSTIAVKSLARTTRPALSKTTFWLVSMTKRRGIRYTL